YSEAHIYLFNEFEPLKDHTILQSDQYPIYYQTPLRSYPEYLTSNTLPDLFIPDLAFISGPSLIESLNNIQLLSHSTTRASTNASSNTNYLTNLNNKPQTQLLNLFI
ncbi:11067_t:CDS:1, partial [Ambispora leptoticha]